MKAGVGGDAEFAAGLEIVTSIDRRAGRGAGGLGVVGRGLGGGTVGAERLFVEGEDRFDGEDALAGRGPRRGDHAGPTGRRAAGGSPAVADRMRHGARRGARAGWGRRLAARRVRGRRGGIISLHPDCWASGRRSEDRQSPDSDSGGRRAPIEEEVRQPCLRPKPSNEVSCTVLHLEAFIGFSFGLSIGKCHQGNHPPVKVTFIICKCIPLSLDPESRARSKFLKIQRGGLSGQKTAVS